MRCLPAFAALLFLALCGTLQPAAQKAGSSSSPSTTQAVDDPQTSQEYMPGEVLVRFKPGVNKAFIEFAHREVQAQVVRSFRVVENLQLVRLPADVTVEEAIETYQQNPDVLYAEPNYIVRPLRTPNDPQFGSQWGLRKIRAPKAWNLSIGSREVVVAVMDTGIDYRHRDLRRNMWRNEADCNTNLLDDDGNGHVDDCHGIDTRNSDSDPMDDDGHGTAVAGVIGAVGNNKRGVVGVNWRVALLACKYLGGVPFGTIAGDIECRDYVRTMRERGVNIVATNNSGQNIASQAVRDAIDADRQLGILFVGAAGNSAQDNDNSEFFQIISDYSFPHTIFAAATNSADLLSSFSNFGRRRVHVGAPGETILTTFPGNGYANATGTSFSTPFVAGLAALLKAQDPSRDWKAIKNLILTGGNSLPALAGKTITGKRINARNAMTCAETILLSRVEPLASAFTVTVGTPVTLASLHINCAAPNGDIQVTISPSGEVVTLLDDGVAPDVEAGDGVYSGQWTPIIEGTFTLSFPGDEPVQVVVSGN